MTKEKKYKIGTALQDGGIFDTVKVAIGGAQDVRTSDTSDDFKSFRNKLDRAEYWQPTAWIKGPDMTKELREQLDLAVTGGDAMKVYEIIFVDEEEEEVVYDIKVVARDKEGALLKVDNSEFKKGNSKLVRELGTVS